MAGGHAHTYSTNERRLKWALGLTTTFLVVEVVGGVLTKSLALISDAAHMFTDSAGLAVALVAMRIAQRPADSKRTFGYYRFEILAAAFNAVLLFLVAMYILYEALQRFISPADVQSIPMLLIASVGLIVNFIAMKLLSEGQEESLNVKGAYLEVWADFLGSIGVMAAAAAIWLTGWTWIDPIVAVGIGLWVLPRTWTLLSESLNILLQGVPEGLKHEEIDAALRALPGVKDIHSLHVWALTSGRHVLSAHIVTPSEQGAMTLRKTIERLLHDKFEITQTTIQFEDETGHGAPDAHDDHHDHRSHGEKDAGHEKST
jgi:cobalt-zinc-cadmium efflux system protein